MSVDTNTAVADYLQFLADPTSMRNDEEIAGLAAERDGASDPISRLRAIEAIKRAEADDGSKYVSAFVQHAREWAAAEGISAESFVEIGVPISVLREAGFVVATTGRSAGSSTTRKRVTVSEIRASVGSEPFTVKSLQDASGASTASVRKAIKEMIDDGSAVEISLDPAYTGRGRAPNRYQKR